MAVCHYWRAVVPTDIRKLFEVYSGIPPEKVVSHVLEIVCLSCMLTNYHDLFANSDRQSSNPKHLTSAHTHASDSSISSS